MCVSGVPSHTTSRARRVFVALLLLRRMSQMKLHFQISKVSLNHGLRFYATYLGFCFICSSLFVSSTSSSIPHVEAMSTFSTSMHLTSVVFVPVIDFDSEYCYTRVDITLRTTMQAPCVNDESDAIAASSCSALGSHTFMLVDASLSIMPAAASTSVGDDQRRFTFGAEDAIHTSLGGNVTLDDMGSAHGVRVFAKKSSHSHALHWCGNAAVRVYVEAKLHSSDATNYQTIARIQTRDFVVVHVPEKACVDLGEQQCFDVGSDAGCFWCQRAQRCVHSSTSIDDAAAQCSMLPKHSPPPPLLEPYSSIQCVGGLQTWPLVAPLHNRNRICMIRRACISDGQITLYLPPSSDAAPLADPQSSVHDARGVTHYDGWSSLTNIHQDVEYPDGDTAGFIPQVRRTAQIIRVESAADSNLILQVVRSRIPSNFVAADDADVHLLQRHGGQSCVFNSAQRLISSRPFRFSHLSLMCCNFAHSMCCLISPSDPNNFGHIFIDDFASAFSAMHLFDRITYRNRIVFAPFCTCCLSNSDRCRRGYTRFVINQNMPDHAASF